MRSQRTVGVPTQVATSPVALPLRDKQFPAMATPAPSLVALQTGIGAATENTEVENIKLRNGDGDGELGFGSLGFSRTSALHDIIDCSSKSTKVIATHHKLYIHGGEISSINSSMSCGHTVLTN